MVVTSGLVKLWVLAGGSEIRFIFGCTVWRCLFCAGWVCVGTVNVNCG